MTHDVLPYNQDGGEIATWNPDKSLKKIAVMEGAEKHFARAKDPEKLFEAVNEKLRQQAEYIVWRDKLPGSGTGGDRRSDQYHSSGDVLPENDPGWRICINWRKKLCRKDETGRTVLDEEKFEKALEATRERCRRMVEMEKRQRKEKPPETPKPVMTPEKRAAEFRKLIRSSFEALDQNERADFIALLEAEAAELRSLAQSTEASDAEGQ